MYDNSTAVCDICMIWACALFVFGCLLRSMGMFESLSYYMRYAFFMVYRRAAPSIGYLNTCDRFFIHAIGYIIFDDTIVQIFVRLHVCFMYTWYIQQHYFL